MMFELCLKIILLNGYKAFCPKGHRIGRIGGIKEATLTLVKRNATLAF